MLVIVANTHDPVAEFLADRWAPFDARMLTPADLSRRGWSHRSGLDSDAAVIGGEVVSVAEVSAVLTRLPCVFEHEPTTIVEEDRAYVAAEMTAFLLSWLSRLRCPVVNRPSPLGLAGPNLRPEGWVRLASSIGIPVRTVYRDGGGYRWSQTERPRTVSVVGQRCFGDVDAVLRGRARLLCRVAQVDLLTAVFEGSDNESALVEAHLWPDLRSPELADAVLEHLHHAATRARARP